MTLQEFYAAVGGDYAETFRRLPSEAMIRKFLLKYPGDPSYGQLDAALDAGDLQAAFRAAHTLKGVAQNLGLERLYKAADAVCEATRHGGAPGDGQWPAVQSAHREVLAALEHL